ncbi:hypothetical protein FXO38_12194 [Capsicum annuum]|uniref:Mannosidase Ig/CBM-like domain-containing protein n=1 Tax=Capsicum annuum TaxID=4072 RepID=A0A2G3AG70_CAPAN|nr:hypothetical protein FXO37_28231 [Capsicum annuum]KAF3660330.1 hypothetical protein FXO38_12194 [Capsicum annuum]PHT93229.1 hypothetical protein T459_01111 [Capsicum annuum]
MGILKKSPIPYGLTINTYLIPNQEKLMNRYGTPKDLDDFCLKVVNTMSEEVSNVAIEASVWDLEGECPYSKTSEKLTVPPRKIIPTFEMKYPKLKNPKPVKYPKLKNPKPVYFLLLKLYNVSDNRIYSRNFYWLHLTGDDYKILETFRERRPPLKIISLTFIKGSSYEMHMLIQNTSMKPDSKA